MKLTIEIEGDVDVVTVEGVRIASVLLKSFTEPTPPGVWFRIVKRDDGVSTVQTVRGRDAAAVIEGSPLGLQAPLTAAQLLAKVSDVVADGEGERPVALMVVDDGVTFAQPVVDCFAAEAGDGDLVWLIPADYPVAPGWAKGQDPHKVLEAAGTGSPPA